MASTVVIGGGVIGLACAYELRRRGERVTVLDMGEPGAACSAGNAGWIVPSFSGPLPGPGVAWTSLKRMLDPESPLCVRPRLDGGLLSWLWAFWKHCNARDHRAGLEAVTALNSRTMALYDALEADGVPFEMHRSGLLFLFLSRTEMDHELEALRRIPAYATLTLLSGDEVRDLEPGVSRAVACGFLAAEERYVRPETLTAGLAKRLAEQQVAVRPRVAVTGLRRRGRTVAAAETSEGAVEAERFLIAAGSWSAALARQAGARLPIQAAKGYSITIRNPALRPRHALELSEAKVACSGYKEALRLAGTLEFSGINTDLDPRRVRAIRRAADRYLVDWRRGDGEVEWVGMRPMAPDGLPVIGRLPGLENAFIATGHGMLGITLAPATATAVAELMCTGRSSVDLSAFDPARFARWRPKEGDRWPPHSATTRS